MKDFVTLQKAAAAVALLGAMDLSIPSNSKAAPINGHICGWDNGKGPKRIDRNGPCPCGCGRKAKKCKG